MILYSEKVMIWHEVKSPVAELEFDVCVYVYFHAPEGFIGPRLHPERFQGSMMSD